MWDFDKRERRTCSLNVVDEGECGVVGIITREYHGAACNKYGPNPCCNSWGQCGADAFSCSNTRQTFYSYANSCDGSRWDSDKNERRTCSTNVVDSGNCGVDSITREVYGAACNEHGPNPCCSRRGRCGADAFSCSSTHQTWYSYAEACNDSDRVAEVAETKALKTLGQPVVASPIVVVGVVGVLVAIYTSKKMASSPAARLI